MERHFRAFGLFDRWQREQVAIPGGFWAQPASYATALASGRTPIGDDVGRFAPDGSWNHHPVEGFLKSADVQARLSTLLALHMGGGPRGPGVALAAKVRDELFPWSTLRGSSWRVSEVHVVGEEPPTDWHFRISRFE